MLFSVGFNTLKKWFKISGTGADAVVEVITLVITVIISLQQFEQI